MGISESKEIRFKNGVSHNTFEFRNHQLGIQSIGRLNLKIQWECMEPNNAASDGSDENTWSLMNVTDHVVYPLLKEPMCLWGGEHSNVDRNFFLVAVEVLSLASKMANGKKTMEDVAKAITIYVNQGLKLIYDSAHGAKYFVKGNFFFLVLFLNKLKENGTIKVNCTDCAAITATFANALGCKLSEKIMGTRFRCNKIVAVGETE